ncbi:MAG: hypothetical protein KTR13_10200 [Saprospiraceae bacterium]|nr:hypothetical protein [Saprospiraceae bacterium]
MDNQFVNTGKDLILNALQERAVLKQHIFRQGKDVFAHFKEALKALMEELEDKMDAIDNSVELYYKEKSESEAEIKFGGDVLVFSLHSNVFNFDETHQISNLPYVREDYNRGYCSVIHVYNFLGDSLKYNRMHDIGYLIARIFVNKDLHFYVEGKRQLGFLYNDFSNMVLNEVYIQAICESAILYALDFDLLVPPYDKVQQITVQQRLAEHIQATQTTAKRMGFQFQADSATNKSK